jgi:hypothetical protein
MIRRKACEVQKCMNTHPMASDVCLLVRVRREKSGMRKTMMERQGENDSYERT